MPLVRTDAVVLHAFDYLETSRILRLATRDAGVQSVLARGARRPRSRYGTALDLFAGGTAEMYTKSGRELHTLAAFDVTRSRGELATDLDRFIAASAVAELVLRFGTTDAHEPLFGALVHALDAIGAASAGAIAEAGLAGAWNLVACLGFAPSVDHCASCHADIAPDAAASFSHPAGGAVCPRCAPSLGRTRTLPAEARRALGAWIAGDASALGSEPERRAHRRLLREFLTEHLTDGRPLHAYDVWERSAWQGDGETLLDQSVPGPSGDSPNGNRLAR